MSSDIPSEIQALLYDPQTSGGFLVSLREAEAKDLLASRPETHVIGRVKARAEKPIEVLA